MFRKRSLATLLILSAVASGALAQDYVSGQDAYAKRDWQAAFEIWTREAEAGSAEAMLGLGNLLDFGLGGKSDPVAAFAMYRNAAMLGNAEAEFNLAVMFDSGVGTTVDKRAAAGWYSLAALGDFPRAQYNLGLMYALGDGVPANSQLAEQWLARAAPNIPASRDLIGSLAPPESVALTAPEILKILIVQDKDTPPVAQVAWSSGAGPDGSRYRVEIGENEPTGVRPVASTVTTASAASLPLPALSDSTVARVIYLTDENYEIGRWTALDGSVLDLGQFPTVQFQIAPDDRRGLGYAERIGVSLERSGVTVTFDVLGDDATDQSAVFYSYGKDADFARNVAEFLPGLDGGEATKDVGLGLGPGVVVVRIVIKADG